MSDFNGGEFIIMGVPGFGLDFEIRKTIRKIQPAGFILFARNIESPRQLRDLTDELRALSKHEPIITVDQEGGRVSRLKEFMSEPPSAKELTDHGDISLIEKHGTITGQLLRLFGFNLNLAPVLDVLVDEQHENSLKGRTYGKSPQEVVKNATAFSECMQREGMLNCGKHYPGYSHAIVDPHHQLPQIQRTQVELESLEWEPFRLMLPLLNTLMIGHVSYPQIDDTGTPASLSSKIVRDVLRTAWNYDGCVLTDDLDMGAIVNKYGSARASELALEAGNDLMLVCHNLDGVAEIAETLSRVDASIQKEAFARISNLKKRLAPPSAFSMEATERLNHDIEDLRAAVNLEPQGDRQ